jgi:catechol 2,3-dioxygenase-like lactoylglutathione lyase family enzyme
MHKSRLSSFVIDCEGEIEEAVRFWSAALGRAVHADKDNDPSYRELEHSDEEPILLVQKVEHQGRIHLDIEADDLDAEAARLEALGAKRIGFVKRWWVMEAPTGQRFCIINPQRGPLEKRSNSWPDKK